jgi:hypothetical protein
MLTGVRMIGDSAGRPRLPNRGHTHYGSTTFRARHEVLYKCYFWEKPLWRLVWSLPEFRNLSDFAKTYSSPFYRLHHKDCDILSQRNCSVRFSVIFIFSKAYSQNINRLYEFANSIIYFGVMEHFFYSEKIRAINRPAIS